MTNAWYLSGPMSGYPNLNSPLFQRVAADFRAHGMAIISPPELCPSDTDWETAMALDLAAMRQAHGVLLLPGWELSRGARIEWAWAKVLGLPRVPIHVGWAMLVGWGREMTWEVTDSTSAIHIPASEH